MKKILFCNVGWMKGYDGIDGDSIQRGGSYNNDSIGHEVCNFSDIDGKVYGYVQPTGRRIAIERLGAQKDESCVSGITVVWVASPDSGGTVVVGWYINATVYREPQPIENPTELQEKLCLDTYLISASVADAKLLPVCERDHMIPRAVKGGGGIGQSNIWYADKPENAEIVERVLRLIKSGRSIDRLPDVDDRTSGLEGHPRLCAHLRRERNVSIVKKKKETVLAQNGNLNCEVCGFDFKKVYGKCGDGFCEVHHLIPLRNCDGLVKTKLSDLAIVCSNCHRIIHRNDPMPSIEELVKVVRASSA